MTTPSDNAFTQSVNALVAKINAATQTKSSLFEQAEIYFQGAQSQQRVIQQLTRVVKEKHKDLDSAKNDIQKNHLRELHNNAKKELKDETVKQARQRYARLKYLKQICTDIIQLCEGRDWQETQQKSAKVLTTLLLLCPHEGNNVAPAHQRCKPLYKAVLSLRLLDQLLTSEDVENQYVVSRFHSSSRFSAPSNKSAVLNLFQRDVARPLVSAALLQDIGMQHPEIQRLLKGSDGSFNPFRVLEKDVRIPLLIMNHEQTMDYVSLGLGTEEYDEENDDSPEYVQRKAHFDKNENNRYRLTQSMLNDAIKPKEALGSTLKAVQIYTSIVLSTKPKFNVADLPKASKVVLHSAQKGALTLSSANGLQKIVGHFPMGYGVVFGPADAQSMVPTNYAYAVVNALNPKHANEPHCLIITTLDTHHRTGKQFTLPQQQNLYFEPVYQLFSKTPAATLKAVAEKIAITLDQPKNQETLPTYWTVQGYFHFKKQQNLWPQ
ncbi:hypothetical protein [Paraglaciecola polaris]|uniref:Uncharacterized protein n=1 Tax=Paraglaciecola polaris LMG 21857 TaxID=1129793 RepID=K6ZCV2_9ALTE|nr:hypothetical protein [Paraglaciecola polaris]GAC33911.1 hypothetical protein GPLA_3018 [Paraglaciecola polaris LMG 21857]